MRAQPQSEEALGFLRLDGSESGKAYSTCARRSVLAELGKLASQCLGRRWLQIYRSLERVAQSPQCWSASACDSQR